MAVDRANLTPEPSTANHYPMGRTAAVKAERSNITPPSQASSGTPVALTGTPFNPGIQT